METNRGNAATATNASTSFVGKAIELNSAEIQLGQLASKKAQNDRVKSFAQMMVKDHTEGLSKFQKLQDQPRTNASSTTNQTADSQNRDTNSADNKSTRDSTSPSASTSSMPAMSSEHRQLMTKLEGLSGAQFDREYINAMVSGHRDAITLFEREAGSTSTTPTAARPQADTARGTNTTTPGARDTAGGTTRTSSGSDSKGLATEMLPVLKRHLQEAEAIQKALK